jgi:hypothetical protein
MCNNICINYYSIINKKYIKYYYRMSQNQTSKNDDIKEKQKEILKYLNKTEDLSIQTIEELKLQEEQIQRIDNISSDINDELNISQKIIKQMTGIKSYFYALFGKSEEQNTSTDDKKNTPKEIQHKKVDAQKEQIQQREKNVINVHENNNFFFDQVHNQLLKIENNAKIQGEMLVRQKNMLDPLNDKLEDMNRKTCDLTDKTKKLI